MTPAHNRELSTPNKGCTKYHTPFVRRRGLVPTNTPHDGNLPAMTATGRYFHPSTFTALKFHSRVILGVHSSSSRQRSAPGGRNMVSQVDHGDWLHGEICTAIALVRGGDMTLGWHCRPGLVMYRRKKVLCLSPRAPGQPLDRQGGASGFHAHFSSETYGCLTDQLWR